MENTKRRTRKLTSKEFWQFLEENEIMNKDIWGYEGLLNTLAIAYSHMAEEDAKRGSMACAKWNKENSRKIVNFLESIGEYDFD